MWSCLSMSISFNRTGKFAVGKGPYGLENIHL